MYNKKDYKKTVEKKMQKDLEKKGYVRESDFFRSDEDFERFMTLYDEEYEKYWNLITVIDEDKWEFFTVDNVAEEIIEPDDDLNDVYRYVDMKEALFQAKCDGIISGFYDLGNDLWLIGDF